MVMEGNSCPECCGFKSHHHILGGHFFTYICWEHCNACLKRQKEKEAGDGQFKNRF